MTSHTYHRRETRLFISSTRRHSETATTTTTTLIGALRRKLRFFFQDTASEASRGECFFAFVSKEIHHIERKTTILQPAFFESVDLNCPDCTWTIERKMSSCPYCNGRGGDAPPGFYSAGQTAPGGYSNQPPTGPMDYPNHVHDFDPFSSPATSMLNKVILPMLAVGTAGLIGFYAVMKLTPDNTMFDAHQTDYGYRQPSYQQYPRYYS